MATISNLFIDQDADFTTTVTVNDSSDSPLDLAGYTAVGMIRKSYSSSTSTSFTIAFVDPRTSGQVTMSLTDVQTGALDSGRYVYDLVITDSVGDKTRVVEGIATIKPSVSR
tara:strand:+ start:322 stop:657 length:336 start_codon:yes stop_codon:yes gene_type:complete